MDKKISFTESANAIRNLSQSFLYTGTATSLAKRIFDNDFLAPTNRGLAAIARSGRTYYSILSVIRRHRAKQAALAV